METTASLFHLKDVVKLFHLFQVDQDMCDNLLPDQ